MANLEEEIALLLYGELHGCTDAQTREEFHFADGGPAVTARHRKLDRDFFRAEIEHIRSVGAKVASLARPAASGWNEAVEAVKQLLLDYPDTDLGKSHANPAVVLNVCSTLLGDLRSLTRPDSPSGWQTIDSAPKDGRVLVLNHGKHVHIAAHATYYSTFYRADLTGWWDRQDWWLEKPTHWCPLPEPPSPREGKSDG